jgi:hypothetical protein
MKVPPPKPPTKFYWVSWFVIWKSLYWLKQGTDFDVFTTTSLQPKKSRFPSLSVWEHILSIPKLHKYWPTVVQNYKCDKSLPTAECSMLHGGIIYFNYVC